MTIAGKTICALLAIFVVLIGGAQVILELAVQPRFDALEADIHARDGARLEANIEALRADITARAEDYAHWDDTYAYIRNRNSRFISHNFYEGWFEYYDVDLLGFVDDAGQVLWAHATDPGAAPDLATAAVRQALERARPSLDGDEPVTGVLWTSGPAPLMVSTARVTTSDASAPRRGFVVLGRTISAAALSDQVQLNVRLVDAAEPGALAPRMAALGGAQSYLWRDADMLHSLLPLRGADNAAVGAVLAERERTISALGRRTSGLALALFTAMSLIALAALWFLLERLAIARIRRIGRHLRAQSTESAELAPIQEPSANDEIGRLVLSYNDLAERVEESAKRERRAEYEREAAAAANRTKSNFLANISQDLLSPLASIIGYAELVEEDLEARGLEESRGDVEQVRATAQQLVGFVNEIFDLSQIEAGRMTIEATTFSVEAMLRDALAFAAKAAQERNIALNLSVADDLGAAYSDEARLQQALSNVFSYCCEQAAEGDAVCVSVRRFGEKADATLRFLVRTGQAASCQAPAAHLFEPFHNLELSAVHKYGGANLGLAVARRMIEALGGRIEASAGAAGAPTFEIEIPCYAPDQGERPGAAAA